MKEFLIIAFMLVALAIVFLVLIQQGKGAGMGASFGAGASGTLFGSSGAGNFLTRLTSILAAIFFGLCLLLANLDNRPVNHTNSDKWLIDEAAEQQQVPAQTESQNQIPTSDAAPAANN